MLFDDKYRTIANLAEGSFSDKGSKFIAYAHPVKSEAGAKALLSKIRTEHPKARHHCWALRLSPNRTVFRINDDGEPSGTAGKPILNVLLSKDLTDILLVVVRYFGGTLLGVPGLIHAYRAASLDALSKAEIIELTIQDVYQLRFDYNQLNEIMKIVKDHRLQILSKSIEQSCEIELAIPQLQVNSILKELSQISFSTIYLRTL